MGNEIYAEMTDDRKTAEGYIINYQQRRKDYDAKKADYLQSKKVRFEKVGGKGNMVVSVVENEALKAAAYDMESPEYLWLRAVEIAFKTLGERKRLFIKARCEAEKKASFDKGRGRRAWVLYTQRIYSELIEERFLNATGWLCERSVRYWWKSILDRVVEIYLRLKINF